MHFLMIQTISIHEKAYDGDSDRCITWSTKELIDMKLHFSSYLREIHWREYNWIDLNWFSLIEYKMSTATCKILAIVN